jgi:transposase
VRGVGEPGVSLDAHGVSLGRDVLPGESPTRGRDRRRPPRTRLGAGAGVSLRAPQVLVGSAGSKAQLDMALRPTDDGWHVSTAEVGIASLVARLRTVPPTLLVLEAPGGWAGPGTGALAEAGRPVVVGHPRQARDVAQATGWLAKTASLEARGLAPFAAAVRPPPRPLPAAQAPALSALLTRWRQLVQRLTAARRRLQTAAPPRRAALQAHRPGLTRRGARTAAAVAAALHASPLGHATDERLPRPPGVGPMRSWTLVVEGPALGVLHRPESAALMGGAPVPRESGPGRGTRAVWGGRAQVRAGLSRRPLAAGRHPPIRKVC